MMLFLLSQAPPSAPPAGNNSAEDLAINLLASLLFSIAGALAYRLLYVPTRKRVNLLTRSLPFDLKRKPITICYGLLNPSATATYYMVEEGDLSAINHADASMSEVFGRKTVRTFNCFVAEAQLGDITNLVSISGPRWNRVTEYYLGRLGSPVTFDKVEAVVARPQTHGEKRYTATYRPSGEAEVCFGFVVVGYATTATGKRQRVAICAGLNNLSTYGAVVFLTSLREHILYRRVDGINGKKLGKQWAAVLRVENATNPERFAPYHAPLDPNQIVIDVVELYNRRDFQPPFVYRY